MRADIDDGPEQETLYFGADYIDARPYVHPEDSSCNERWVHTSGQITMRPVNGCDALTKRPPTHPLTVPHDWLTPSTGS